MKKIFILLLFCLALFQGRAQTNEINKAKSLINSGEYLDAAKLLRPLAENGNAEAQYLAGCLFLEGKGVIKSKEQAEKFLLLAAKNGNKDALPYAAKIYEEKNDSHNLFWALNKLCSERPYYLTKKEGFKLGYMYFNGIEIAEDKEKGWEMMYKALNSDPENYEKLHAIFVGYFESIVDYYFDMPFSLFNVLSNLWKGKCEKYWIDEKLPYLMSKVEKLNYADQTNFFDIVKNYRIELTDYITALMYDKGWGVEKNVSKAQYYLSYIYERKVEMCENILALKKKYKNITSSGQNFDK